MSDSVEENAYKELPPYEAEYLTVRHLDDGRVGIAFWKRVDLKPYNHLATVQVPPAILLELAAQLQKEFKEYPAKYSPSNKRSDPTN